MDESTISLRPMALRPGGGVNPFAGFGKGAGVNLKNKAQLGIVKDEKKKPRSDVIKYTREFMMSLAEHYTQVPQALQRSDLELLLDPNDPGREAQKALIKNATEQDIDDRDWRTRAPAPEAAAGGGGDGKEKQDGGAAGIQKATDIGRQAWAAGTTVEGTAASIRKIKGILNKLTPEKFDRLLSQLIPLIDSYEILRNTITQVFENAVQQPTFVAMYADFCAELDAALPEFPPPADQEDAPKGFKKMLANTCQTEYESTEEARNQALSLPQAEREEAEKHAKQRLLGNIRLISELFKKDMVNDRIMLLILSDLLGPADSEPSDDSIEAVCELLSIAGSDLEKTPKSKNRLDAIFNKLTKMSTSKTYPARIKFVIRDVLDLHSQNWVARREAITAKKLDDIRQEAVAELGVLNMAIPGMEGLPAMPGLSTQKAADVELFPAFKQGNNADFGGNGNAANGDKFSAFLGDFVPMKEAAAEAGGKEGGGIPARVPRKDLTPEMRHSLGKSLYTDYLSSPSLDEAVGSAQELETPGFAPTLVQIGLEKAFEILGDKEQLSLVDLIAALSARGIFTGEDLRDGVGALTAGLDDIALDVPSAPRLLGRLLGSAVAGGLLGLNEVASQVKSVESAEPRRMFVAAALHAVKENAGEDALKEYCEEAKIDMNALLAADPEFDPPELPDVPIFLKAEGLEAALV